MSVTYHVLNDNALGYIDSNQPHTFCVLRGDVFKGGPDPLNGPVAYQQGIDTLRDATLDDFAAYRVSPVGFASTEKEGE